MAIHSRDRCHSSCRPLPSTLALTLALVRTPGAVEEVLTCRAVAAMLTALKWVTSCRYYGVGYDTSQSDGIGGFALGKPAQDGYLRSQHISIERRGERHACAGLYAANAVV